LKWFIKCKCCECTDWVLKRIWIIQFVSSVPKFSQSKNDPKIEAGDHEERDDPDERAVQDVVEQPKLVFVGIIA
jgi:hypothetical protein